jgi:ABC-2 type transport system ATP-binding protein
VIRESHTDRQTTLVVRGRRHVYESHWQPHEIDLEEIVLAYLGRESAAPPMLEWPSEAVPA